MLIKVKCNLTFEMENKHSRINLRSTRFSFRRDQIYKQGACILGISKLICIYQEIIVISEEGKNQINAYLCLASVSHGKNEINREKSNFNLLTKLLFINNYSTYITTLYNFWVLIGMVL